MGGARTFHRERKRAGHGGTTNTSFRAKWPSHVTGGMCPPCPLLAPTMIEPCILNEGDKLVLVIK